jgi:hypothetical protein
MRHSLRFTSHYDYRDHRSPAYTLHNFGGFCICLCMRFSISILKFFEFSYIFNFWVKIAFLWHSMSLLNMTTDVFIENLCKCYTNARKKNTKKLNFFEI